MVNKQTYSKYCIALPISVERSDKHYDLDSSNIPLCMTSSKRRFSASVYSRCFNAEGYPFLNICHVPDIASKLARDGGQRKSAKICAACVPQWDRP